MSFILYLNDKLSSHTIGKKWGSGSSLPVEENSTGFNYLFKYRMGDFAHLDCARVSYKIGQPIRLLCDVPAKGLYILEGIELGESERYTVLLRDLRSTPSQIIKINPNQTADLEELDKDFPGIVAGLWDLGLFLGACLDKYLH